VAKSSLPDSGEGVFAVKDLPADRCVTLYSGLFYDYLEQRELFFDKCVYNESRSDVMI
jgi:hypothetical protein